MAFSVPPTTNDLTRAQRLRLMRSTRKLSEVLGVTPVFMSGPQTASSLSLSRHSKGKALPRPLVLTLKSISASLSPPGPSPTVSAPLSPIRSPNVPVSPASPRRQSIPREDRLQQTRRKRMAKLQRTLGENIPPELVLDAAPKRPSRPRSSSIEQMTLTAAFKVQIIEHAKIHKMSSSPTHDPSLSTSSWSKASTRQRDRHSSFVGMEGLHLEEVEVGRKSSDTVCSDASTSSSEYRKQAGWSGEWNRDMTHVLTQLRELRA
ncbi:hypothetical protein D9757_004161 [Collybiopsis confluens]|uniref:Uncharacterized protein n=1 Tax=Collybiopsis confluens TaxID=2823264 RepID=A0A8H5HU08_9AGAR|nr:hypothetical protein D9757_004161 [Collybiopsis confluens]